jgi:hypothetical protein
LKDNIMKKLAMRCVLATALCAGALAGCGGDGDSGSGSAGSGIGQNVSDLIAYVKGLIATDENSDPVDVNALSLAVDDAGDPASL